MFLEPGTVLRLLYVVYILKREFINLIYMKTTLSMIVPHQYDDLGGWARLRRRSALPSTSQHTVLAKKRSGRLRSFRHSLCKELVRIIFSLVRPAACSL